jgi:hypothetical protein
LLPLALRLARDRGDRVAFAKGTFLRIEFEQDRGRLVERV